jgi:hypothetical protein
VQDVQVNNNVPTMFQNPMIQTIDSHHQQMQPTYAAEQQ